MSQGSVHKRQIVVRKALVCRISENLAKFCEGVCAYHDAAVEEGNVSLSSIYHFAFTFRVLAIANDFDFTQSLFIHLDEQCGQTPTGADMNALEDVCPPNYLSGRNHEWVRTEDEVKNFYDHISKLCFAQGSVDLCRCDDLRIKGCITRYEAQLCEKAKRTTKTRRIQMAKMSDSVLSG